MGQEEGGKGDGWWNREADGRNGAVMGQGGGQIRPTRKWVNQQWCMHNFDPLPSPDPLSQVCADLLHLSSWHRSTLTCRSCRGLTWASGQISSYCEETSRNLRGYRRGCAVPIPLPLRDLVRIELLDAYTFKKIAASFNWKPASALLRRVKANFTSSLSLTADLIHKGYNWGTNHSKLQCEFKVAFITLNSYFNGIAQIIAWWFDSFTKQKQKPKSITFPKDLFYTALQSLSKTNAGIKQQKEHKP